MFQEKVDINSFYRAIKNFKDLGSGRKKKRVLVGESADARTAKFIFVGYVCNNWPSWKQVTIQGEGKTVLTFDTARETVYGKPAYIFPWNDLTEDLWLTQVEREKLLNRLGLLSPSDFIAVGQWVCELSGSDIKIANIPEWVSFYYGSVQIEIHRLSLPALRLLNSVVEMNGCMEAGPVKAA